MIKMKQIVCCALLACSLPMVISADSGYSTENDPLITLSYLEQVYKPALKQQILSELSLDDLTDEMKNQIKQELTSEMNAQLASMKSTIKSELTASIKADLEKSLSASLKTTLTEQLTKELTTKLTASISQSVKEELTKQLTQSIHDQIVADLSVRLEQEISASLEEKLEKELSASLTADLTKSISDKITKELTEKLQKEMQNRFDQVFANGIPDGLGASYDVVTLSRGQTLMANGPVEIIMTYGLGEAVNYDGDEQGRLMGIYDLTEGKRVLFGQEILQRHHIVISNSSRGVYVTSEEAYFMIRGEYTIVQQDEQA